MGVLRFDGVNDYVTGEENAAVSSANEVVIAMEVELSDINQNDNKLIEFGSRTQGARFLFGTQTNGTFRIQSRNASGSSLNHVSPSLTADTVYILAMSVNFTTGRVICTLNGSEFSNIVQSALQGLNVEPTRTIGAEHDGAKPCAFDLHSYLITSDGTDLTRFDPDTTDRDANALLDKIGNDDGGTLVNFSATATDHFIGVQPPITEAITNVGTNNFVVDGQQNVPLNVIGMGQLTEARLKVGSDTLLLSGLTGSGDNYTVNFPDVSSYTSDTAGLPFSTGNYQNEIEVTDGTNTVSINITRNPKVGYAVVDVVNALGDLSAGRATPALPVDGSQYLYSTANNTTVFADDTYETDVTGDLQARLWDVATNNWEFVEVTIVESDTIAPVITLLGDATVTIQEGETYTDAGATALDNNDGDLTGSIDVVNPVDTNTTDTYTITYNVSDAAGNAATEVVRTVTVTAVADTTPPVITLDPPTLNYNLSIGDVVPTITASTDDGSPVTETGIINNQLENTPQTLTFNSTDSAGNQATPVVVTFTFQAASANDSFIALQRADYVIDENIVKVFADRANVETLTFKVSGSNSIATINGYLDFDSNNITRVEVMTRNGLLSSDTNAISFVDDKLFVEFGLLNETGPVAATIIIYVGSDSKGIVIAGPGQKSNLILQFDT